MIKKVMTAALMGAVLFTTTQASAVVGIYASSLSSSSNVTAFGSGDVTGAPDGGGLWLGSTSDPPAILGSFTVCFATALGNGAGTDLEILDLASSPDETFTVEVSWDNILFSNLGEFSATNNLVDFGAFNAVSYVRLTNTSLTKSADIDALWGNEAAAVPEPMTLLLMGVGLGGATLRRRFSKRS